MRTINFRQALVGLALVASSVVLAADLEKATPDSVGLSAARLARIDSVLRPYIDNKQLAGAVVGVARKNKLVYMKSFGSADIDAGTAMKDDAIFRIASMTKPVPARPS